jgi:transposase
VRRLLREESDVAVLVEELPGIGPLSAATLLAELGEAKRFSRARVVAAYAGLVPRVSQSAEKAHQGKMTKAGELRVALDPFAVGGSPDQR